jgi:hypothetical protein
MMDNDKAPEEEVQQIEVKGVCHGLFTFSIVPIVFIVIFVAID